MSTRAISSKIQPLQDECPLTCELEQPDWCLSHICSSSVDPRPSLFDKETRTGQVIFRNFCGDFELKLHGKLALGVVNWSYSVEPTEMRVNLIHVKYQPLDLLGSKDLTNSDTQILCNLLGEQGKKLKVLPSHRQKLGWSV